MLLDRHMRLLVLQAFERPRHAAARVVGHDDVIDERVAVVARELVSRTVPEVKVDHGCS